jgi:hypothetical protein
MRTPWELAVVEACAARNTGFEVVNLLTAHPPPDGLPPQPLAAWAAALFAELVNSAGGSVKAGCPKRDRGRGS